MADDISPKGVAVVLHAYDGTDLKYLDWDTIEALKTALEKIDDLRNALDSVGTDELDVNVEASVLPTGAATEATLAAIAIDAWRISQAVYTLNRVWAYNDRYVEFEYTDTAAAGNNTLTFSTVPAGEVWVVKGGIFFNQDSAMGFFSLELYNDGAFQGTLKYEANLLADERVELGVPLTLKEGDNVRATFGDCTLNDDLRATLWGYKMQV